MKTIYQQRITPNNWEILGIENFFKYGYEIDEMIYSDNTLHFDIEDNRFGIYKISHGEDIFITLFNDDSDNRTFRLDTSRDLFIEMDEDFNFIQSITDLNSL
jgi:hypothetical protein